VKVGGVLQPSPASSDPAFHTAVYYLAIPPFMRLAPFQKYLKTGAHYVAGEGGERQYIQPTDNVQAKAMYWKLGERGRRAFDTSVEVNVGANPEIGGAYTMATEYDMPGFKKNKGMTWNFHWAGVVMKDGDNNVTLENYAVALDGPEGYAYVDRDWAFQIYGTKKVGQTFHKEHLASRTHGTRASTFAVKAPKEEAG
jgi:hypothetical protein